MVGLIFFSLMLTLGRLSVQTRKKSNLPTLRWTRKKIKTRHAALVSQLRPRSSCGRPPGPLHCAAAIPRGASIPQHNPLWRAAAAIPYGAPIPRSASIPRRANVMLRPSAMPRLGQERGCRWPGPGQVQAQLAAARPRHHPLSLAGRTRPFPALLSVARKKKKGEK